jgi:hypothetical protein
LVAVRQQVSVGRWAWTDPVQPQGAFPEERLAEFGPHLDPGARGIVQVVLLAVDLRASVRSQRQSQELKKPLPDASRRAQMAVPEPFLEQLTGELEAQAVARLAQQKVRQAERQLEQWWLAHLAVAREQSEPLQVERCWPRVFLLERPAQLQ